MEQACYLFNPDNELALADGSADYLSPASARKMEEDLSFLPVWWACNDSRVLVSSIALALRWQEKHAELVPSVCFSSYSLPAEEFTRIIPWGWNAALRKKLIKWGVGADTLPSDEQLSEIRRLSNRSVAVELLSELNEFPYTCGTSSVCRDESETAFMLKDMSSFIMKAPWSGSGKGLWRGNDKDDTSLRNWYRRILNAQGSVIVEPFYDKVQDFAMEFYLHGDGIISWIGYSLFATDEKGRYASNILQNNQAIETILSSYLPELNWSDFRFCLMEKLAGTLKTGYAGFFGIDMMIVRSSIGEYNLHPCVEINLRMNMGIVSRLFYDRFVSPGSQGTFSVRCFSSSEELNAWYSEQEKKNPLHVEEGRIISGYLSLAPVGKDTRYIASVLIS